MSSCIAAPRWGETRAAEEHGGSQLAKHKFRPGSNSEHRPLGRPMGLRRPFRAKKGAAALDMLGGKHPELRVTEQRLSALLAALGTGLGVLLLATAAAANGAFPAVSQLVSDPADPDHLVLRSTFGLLVTRDR